MHPHLCGLLVWGIIPSYNQIILYISDWYMALWKSLKNIYVWSSRWRALYRVGSINFDMALISCLRGKFTGWLALIPQTHKTITNVIQSVFTQLMSFRFSDRHGEHTVSLFWIIVHAGESLRFLASDWLRSGSWAQRFPYCSRFNFSVKNMENMLPCNAICDTVHIHFSRKIYCGANDASIGF